MTLFSCHQPTKQTHNALISETLLAQKIIYKVLEKEATPNQIWALKYRLHETYNRKIKKKVRKEILNNWWPPIFHPNLMLLLKIISEEFHFVLILMSKLTPKILISLRLAKKDQSESLRLLKMSLREICLKHQKIWKLFFKFLRTV